MRRILAIAILSCSLQGWGQQAVQYTQYMLNPFAINPALAGRKPCADFRMGYKMQWVDVEGAPKFGYLNASFRLKNKSGNYLSPYHGLGGQVERDDIGPFGQTRIALIYAITVPFNRTLRMSMGAAVGVRQFSFSSGKAMTIDPDPAITESAQRFMVPDGNIGLFLENGKFFAGLNFDNLFANKWKDFGYESRMRVQTILMGGYKLSLPSDLEMLISGLMKFGKRVPPALDINATLEYRRWLAFGIGYRYTDAFMALVRFRFFSKLSVAYSFDFITSQLGPGSKYSHELSLAFSTCQPPARKGATDCADFQ